MAMKPVDLIGRRQALIGLGGGALVAGCDSVLPGVGKAPRLYNLTPKSTFPEGLPPVDWQLLVETPYASASLNTARIGFDAGADTVRLLRAGQLDRPCAADGAGLGR